jgi:hypothetical protein
MAGKKVEILSLTNAKKLIKDNELRTSRVRNQSRCLINGLYSEATVRPSPVHVKPLFKDKDILPSIIDGESYFLINDAYGGIKLFESREDAELYLKKETVDYKQLEYGLNNICIDRESKIKMICNEIMICAPEKRRENAQKYLDALTLYEVESESMTKNYFVKIMNGEIKLKNNC